MADTIRAFAGDPTKAEALVRRQQAALIVLCRTANDFTNYRRARKDSLGGQLYAGTPPAWLEAVPSGSGAGRSLWRVKAGQRDGGPELQGRRGPALTDCRRVSD